MSKPKLGIRCKLYVNTGSRGSPTWLEVKTIKDFKESVSWQKAMAAYRSSRVGETVKTILDLSWQGVIKRATDEATAKVRAAAFTDDALDCLILDGPRSEVGSTGFRVDCQVFSLSNDQGTGSRVDDEIELLPTAADNEPMLARVHTGGVLQYAEITGDDPTFA